MNTTNDFEGEAERTHRYWKAAISCLSTPEKRAAAEEFLRRYLESGSGADTLFALILLLEANGAFLLRLPEEFHREFTQPVADQLGAFRAALLAHEKWQQDALVDFDKVQVSFAAAAALIQQNRQELAVKIQMAAASVDAPGIANSISRTLETTVLHLLKFSLGNLEKSTAQAIQATQAAERTVETWRKIHLRGIVLTAILFPALLAGSVLCRGWWSMENHYRTRLAAQIMRLDATDEAYRQLLWLGVSIGLAPREDESGKPVPDGYTITINPAETATVQAGEFGHKALVTLKAQSLPKRLESLGKNVDKLKANLPQDLPKPQ